MKKTPFVFIAAGIIILTSSPSMAQNEQYYAPQNQNADNVQVINRSIDTTPPALQKDEFFRAESDTVTAGDLAKREMDMRAQNNMGSTRATSTNNLGIGLDLGNRGQR